MFKVQFCFRKLRKCNTTSAKRFTSDKAKKEQENLSKYEQSEVAYKNGVLSVGLPLPSRAKCFFPLYPERTLDELTVDIRAEERPHSEIFATDTAGNRIPLTTPLAALSLRPFLINVDGTPYYVDLSKPEKPPLENLLGTSDVTDLTLKSYFREIKRKLKESNRTFVSLENYHQLCKDTGLTEPQAQDLLSAMHFSGDVLHFRDSPELKKYVFLFPDNVSDTLIKELGILFTIRDVPRLSEELKKILPAYLDLNKVKVGIDGKADRSARLWMVAGLGYLLVQFGILARMVWWDFNWDIMEPISYFVSFSTLMLGYIFFVLYREEYTYDALYDRQRKKALKQLYIKEEFNWKRWNELHIQVESLRELIGPHDLTRLYDSEKKNLTAESVAHLESSIHDYLKYEQQQKQLKAL